MVYDARQVRSKINRADTRQPKPAQAADRKLPLHTGEAAFEP